MKKIYSSLIFLTLVLFCSQGETSDKPVKVLLAFDLTGSLKTTAALLSLGVELKLKELKKTTKDIEITKIDIGDNITSISKAVTESIKSSSPDIIIGAITSREAFVIGEIAESHHIPFITPYATNDLVTHEKKFVFRSCFDDSFQTKKIASFAFNDLKLRRGLVLFNDSSEYAKAIKTTFKDEFLKFKGTTVQTLPFQSEKDFDSDTIEKIKAIHPQFVLLPSYQIESAAIIARISNQLPSSTVFLGTDSWGGGRLFNNIVRDKVKDFKGFYVQHWSQESASKENKKFLKLLKDDSIPANLKFTGTAMNTPVAMGYDVMGLINDALSKKGDFSSNMRNETYHGVSGTMKFENSQTPGKSMFVYAVDADTEHLVKKLE